MTQVTDTPQLRHNNNEKMLRSIDEKTTKLLQYLPPIIPLTDHSKTNKTRNI